MFTGLYKDYASLFRNNRQIRNLAVPSNDLYYGTRYLFGAYERVQVPLQALGSRQRLAATILIIRLKEVLP